jgi:hypothetical protein
MSSWTRTTLITLGCAGWLVLAGCHRGAAVPPEEKPAIASLRGDSSSPATQPATKPPDRSRLSLGDVNRHARREMAPQLLAMLKDPAYAEDWGLIAQILPAARPDARSASAIIDYITRKDDWRGLHGGALNSRMTAKVAAVHALGSIHSPEAIAFLRKVLESAQSARSILRHWLNDKNPPEPNVDGPDTILSIFMNQAARGLVIARDPEGIALIRQRNEQFGSYPGAMALNRVIEEKGLDWYRQNGDDAARSLERKYWLEDYGKSRQKWGVPLPPLPSKPSDRPSSRPATRPEGAWSQAEQPSSVSQPATQSADGGRATQPAANAMKYAAAGLFYGPRRLPPDLEKLRDLEGFIKHPWPKGEPQYRQSREFVSPQSVPRLHAMLKDPAWAAYWGTIAYVIGHISDDEASVPILLDYAQRKEDFSGMTPTEATIKIGPRFRVIRWLGRIGGPEATKALRAAVTVEGSQKIAEAWADDRRLLVYWDGKHAAGKLIADSATVGLVLTRDPDNIKMVERIYQEGIALPRLVPYGAYALALNRVIEQRGLENVLSILNTEEEAEVVRPITIEYMKPLTDYLHRQAALSTNPAPGTQPATQSANRLAKDGARNAVATMLADPSLPVSHQNPADALHRLEYHELRKLVTVHGVPFDFVNREVKPEQLAELYKMLDDPAFSLHWGNIARIIGLVARQSENPEAVGVLLGYTTRAEDWRGQNRHTQSGGGQGKIFALHSVGMIGGKLADETLRQAVTLQGAQNMIRHWADKSPEMLPGAFGSMRSIARNVRGSAAVGLILTREPENIAIVQQAYEQEHVYPEDWQQKGLCYADMSVMTDAMAFGEMISDRGWEYYLERTGTEEEFRALTPYLDKYISYPPDWPRAASAEK